MLSALKVYYLSFIELCVVIR